MDQFKKLTRVMEKNNIPDDKILKSILEQFHKKPEQNFQQLIKMDISKIDDYINFIDMIGEHRFKNKIKNESNLDEIKAKKPYKSVYKSKPLTCLGFDTEDDSKGNPHLFIFHDGKKPFVFFDKVKAMFWLITSDFKNDVIVWCVNTEYDLNNLSYPYNFVFDRLYTKSRLILAKPFFTNSVKFYDLINFYSLSAKKVGELFGIKKLDFNFKRKRDKKGKLIITKKENGNDKDIHSGDLPGTQGLH